MPSIEEFAKQELINEAVDEALLKDEIKQQINEAIDPQPEVVHQQNAFSFPQFDFNWLLKKTGEGSIEDYLIHPLNSKENIGIAQILRGVTGFAGACDLAIIDIALGFLKLKQEEKKNAVSIQQGYAFHDMRNNAER